MRKGIILFVSGLLLFTSAMQAKDFNDKSGKAVEDRIDDTLCDCQYAKDYLYVYFNGKKVKGADVKSFKAYEDGYGKDDRYIYYKGEEIKGNYLSLKNIFEVLGDGYAKDDEFVYYKGVILEGANAKSFQLLK